jgi:hypothetical protein
MKCKNCKHNPGCSFVNKEFSAIANLKYKCVGCKDGGFSLIIKKIRDIVN